MNGDVPEWDVLVDERGRVSFAHPAVARAYLRGKFAGKACVALFREVRQKRSDRQNRGFHAMVWPWLMAKPGWTIGRLKMFALGEVFGWIDLTHPLTGQVFTIPAETSTADLSVGQFCELIEGVLVMAAEQDGVVLVAPDEYRRAKEAEAKRLAREARKKEAAA